MNKYRKRPVVIEAIEFKGDGDNLVDICGFMDSQDIVTVSHADPDNPKLKIETLEGTMLASVGDFVIKGVQGEFYPCKPDIFKKTYEKVEE